MVKSECIPNSVADARTPQRLLDFDILSCIMSHISAREDLLSCMRTSSSLYTAGIPLLLSFPCLILPQRLRSFHEFLVSRAPASFLNLRDVFFVLYRHDITSTDIELFKDILRKASALEKLRLFGDVLGEDGEARDIVVSLNTLKTLRIYHDSDDEKDLILSRLQAPLEDVRVDFSQKRDVFSLLADFRNTLETINITGARFSGTDLCYRNVTSLEISYYDELRLSVLVPALPNLQKLDVAFSEMTMEDPEMEALREDNLQFQQARVSPMWNLTFLSADANSLYALALQIKVPRVRVVELMPLGMEGDGDPAWWNSTMAVLRPTQLILMGDFPIVDCDQDLSERFCEGMEELRQLHVTVQWLADGSSLQDYMEFFVTHLFPLGEHTPGLAALSFHLHMSHDYEQNSPTTALQNLDTAALARRAITVVPSITTVRFEIELDETNKRHHYWSPDAHGGVVEDAEKCYTVMKELEDTYGIPAPEIVR